MSKRYKGRKKFNWFRCLMVLLRKDMTNGLFAYYMIMRYSLNIIPHISNETLQITLKSTNFDLTEMNTKYLSKRKNITYNFSSKKCYWSIFIFVQLMVDYGYTCVKTMWTMIKSNQKNRISTTQNLYRLKNNLNVKYLNTYVKASLYKEFPTEQVRDYANRI